ncbi:chorismate lyase [Marinobacter mobilis]|uniref:Probable chorismate pyruvate-lyase n=2 Tax=Marinobacter mobilis TaxID=488533 RepID=A0A1H2Q399_9GAMM|nr:chorismate lyase [Marinobacter mobilis]
MRRGFMPSRDSERSCIPPTIWHRSLAAASLKVHGIKPASRYWLQLEGSLTKALQLCCQHSFHVEVVREGFLRPTREEALTLNIPQRQLAWIREVRLCGDGEPWVLARTIIPRTTLDGKGRRLRHLGRMPLGAYLFSHRQWRRGPFETGLCQARNASQPDVARRSCFNSPEGSLLVGEYFLPTLLAAHPLGRT